MERAGQFAQRLHEACDDQGLPVHGRATRVAEKLRVTPQAAQKWFSGKAFPDMANAIGMSEFLDVTLNWLLTGHGPKRHGTADVNVQRLGEAVQEMPQFAREQVLDFLEFSIKRGQLFVGEREKRYMASIEALRQAPSRR